MSVWEVMGRIAHAKDTASMAQKKMGDLWQWICGREELRVGLDPPTLDDLEMCDAAIEKLELALHDLKIVREELRRADR